MDVQLHVYNQSVQRLDNYKPVANSRGYLHICVSFSEEWDNKTIDCIGYSTSAVQPIEFNPSKTRENVWVVPPEVIKMPSFSVSFVGIDENGTRITTNVIKIPIVESGYVSGTLPEDEDFTKYEKIMADIANAKKDVEASATNIADKVTKEVVSDDEVSSGKTWSSEKIMQKLQEIEMGETEYATADDLKDLDF